MYPLSCLGSGCFVGNLVPLLLTCAQKSHLHICIYTYTGGDILVQWQIYKNVTIDRQILAHIGHRCGHQSGLDESSGQTSVIFQNGFATCFYSMLRWTEQAQYYNILIFLTNWHFGKKDVAFSFDARCDCDSLNWFVSDMPETQKDNNVIYKLTYI